MTHIEHLLLAHDCVILPKFGGFVLRSVPAVYGKDEHLFQPARKEIMFNVTLQHTDGLLSGSYMRLYGVTYLKAQLMLEEDIDALKTSLQQDREVACGRIGSFSLGEEGQVVFKPGESGVFNADSYGLEAFHFSVLRPLAEEGEEVALLTGKKRKDVLYIPVSRRFIKGVAVSVAAVALFFVISTPVKEVNQSAYTASFVPTEMMSYKLEEPAALVTPLDTPVSVPAEELIMESVAKKEVPKAVVNSTSTPVVSSPSVSPASASKMYYIVIASLPTEAQADKILAGVSRGDCKNVSKIERDGKYRVYADRFDNRRDAESYMATLRKSEKYKDAWLFISR